MEKLALRTKDGVEINMYLTPSEFEGKIEHAILIAPALGVPAKFYDQFATYFAKCGFDVFSFDYRTSGPNGSENPRLMDAGVHDLDTVFDHLTVKYKKVAFVGHSLGGQLLGLASLASRLSCAVFVASSLPNPANMNSKLRWQTGLMKYLLLPFFRIKGRFPSRRLGLSSIDLPSTIARDWGTWLRSPSYLFDYLSESQLCNYRSLRLPVLALGVSDDELAPERNIDLLLAQYSSANIESVILEIEPKMGTCGHMGFFKEAHGISFWSDLGGWILKKME